MADNNRNLTVYQKLTQVFGFPNEKKEQEPQQQQQIPKVSFRKDELLKTQSKEEYEKALLQAQQSQYIADKWTKLDQSLYNQSVYYEPNRLSAYYDYESMEFSIHGDTKIATPDGFITIKELADKGRGHEFITYAYDHNLKKVVPAIARNAHYTRDEMAYKITFDDGSHIIATYGHRFLKRDGVFCEVENLKPGDSMMPFYRKSFYNNEKYNWVYTCNSKEGHHGWVAEHNLIAEWFYKRKIEKGEEVHHKDFNGKNNMPNNLQIMTISEHRAYHARLNNEKLWSNPEYRQKMSEVARRKGKISWNGQRKGKNNPSYLDIEFNKIIETARIYRNQEKTAKHLGISIAKLQDELKLNGFKNWMTFLDVYGIERYIPNQEDRDSLNFKVIPWDLIIEVAKIKGTMQSTADFIGIKLCKLRSALRMGGYKNWGTFMEAYGMKKSKAGRKKSNEPIINHKIVSIEPYGIVPVYDLTVPGYKNFATDTIFSHNTPEISAALDIYSEESTTMSEKGEILTIYSESDRVKEILTDLFVNKLDVNTNLQMWTRGLCKYGDNFVYLKIDQNEGIVGCQQLPNIEIERWEGASSKTPNNIETTMPSRELRFKWSNKELEFQSWEIAHFRLLGDDRKLPYGTSMLDKIRRIWKQLLLAEDAMLIYRTSRAPERRVFKVFVGNMDDKDIEPYVQRVANKFKRDPIQDPRNGQVDMRYNQMAIDQDYFIPIRDPAQASPIETLAGAQNLGEIADIEYIQKKMLAALRIPKAFLGFEEVVGDGKQLALMDIRFARTINRIQKSLIQELNKIALIHLYLLGLEDELSNFTLALTNPSAQSDLLKIEQWKEKITLYKDATSDQSQIGILPVSHTWAKKNILGMSDSEVVLDLQQQRIERAIGFELTNTQNVIKRTRVFDEVDSKYGIPEEERKKAEEAGAAPTGGDMGGMMGGGGTPPPAEAGGGEPPLSESIKNKFPNIFGVDAKLTDLFDVEKAQKNIYEIENKINDILND
jgi:intein/homing endonuclease